MVVPLPGAERTSSSPARARAPVASSCPERPRTEYVAYSPIDGAYTNWGSLALGFLHRFSHPETLIVRRRRARRKGVSARLGAGSPALAWGASTTYGLAHVPCPSILVAHGNGEDDHHSVGSCRNRRAFDRVPVRRERSAVSAAPRFPLRFAGVATRTGRPLRPVHGDGLGCPWLGRVL